MAGSSWILYFTGGLFKGRAPEFAQTARHYLQLTTECMERVRMRVLLEDSKSTDVKFNHEQCKYLATKLDCTIHRTLLESHFPESLAAPEDAAKCLELYTILLMLAKEVEGFIERCSKENWIQAAVILANMSDHVWSLSSDLELCAMFFSFMKSRCLTSKEFSDIRSLELELVKEKALIDDETLIASVRALIESGKASYDDYEVATILLARIDRLRQQSPHLGTSESSLLSVYEKEDISSLKYDEKIGNGGFATVYKAIWCGVEVAVKTFYGPESPEFRKEVSICARVSHPNTASLLFYGVENGECFIVMELMDGDLQSLMRTRLRCNRARGSPFCIFVALDLMLQIAEGMSYLHKLRIVHRDLKSYNILVRCAKSTKADGHEYVHAKVADFGLSSTKEKSMTYSNQTLNMGTTRWMAPEMFECGSLVKKEAFPFKSDVYSFAIVCYEILTGKFPFTNVTSNAEVRRKVLAGDRPELPDQCPSKLRRLIERCWSPEQRARPRFADICLELAYLKSLQMSWSSVGTYAVSNSVACVHPVAAIKNGDVAHWPLPVVNKQVILAESSEPKSLAEVLAPVETEANSLTKVLAPVETEAESLEEVLALVETEADSVAEVLAPVETEADSLGEVLASIETEANSLAEVLAFVEIEAESQGEVLAPVETEAHSLAKVLAPIETEVESLAKVLAPIETEVESLAEVPARVETEADSLGEVLASVETKAESLAKVLAPVENKVDSLILQARKVRLAQFKQELQELLVSYSNVIPLTSFVTTYKQLYQKDLNVRDFGVYNLYALLQKVTDVALLKMRCRESVAQMCLVAV